MNAANLWTFKLPTAVTFGDGCVRQLPQIAAARGARPLLVADRDFARLPTFARVQEVLPGVPVFSDVTPDPTVASVDALAARLRAERHDVVIVVGGGSAMDCAKAAACLAAGTLPSIRAVHSEGVPLGLARLPLIAVPTTAGTGSEVTPFAVLSDSEKQVKGPIAGDALYPVHAVVDPELTHSLPLKVTVVTGLDALSHAIEGYWSRNHQPICDVMAIEAARLICANLKRAAQQPGDAETRAAMSYAATLAGAAFQLPKNAMVHACSFPLSARYHLAHGTACAFTLEEAIRFNADPDKRPLPRDLAIFNRPNAGASFFYGRHGSKRTEIMLPDKSLGGFSHLRNVQKIRDMERATQKKRRATGMVPNAVLINFRTDTITGVKCCGNFRDLLRHDRRRQKGIQSFLDLPEFVGARGFEMNDLAFRMNAGVRASARGADLHLAVKKGGKCFLERLLNSGFPRLHLEPEERGTVILEDEFDVSHFKP